MNTLEQEVKQLIIDTLLLEDISPSDIDPHAPIFGDGLGLDSIDALELGVAIKKRYNITINSDDANTRQHFESVHNLAQFIQENRR